MKNDQLKIILILFFIFTLLMNYAFCQEPAKPYVDTIFAAEKEAKIEPLSGLTIKEAVEQLKETEFIINADFLNKGIFVAFRDRINDVIAFSLQGLELPRIEVVDGKRVSRSSEIFIFKKILQVFPEESLPEIEKIYKLSTPAAKSNLIQVLGNMAGIEARDMLIAALDDKAFCEEEDPEMEGEPMRICDVAYNQLVLRYQIKDVLRTIGPAHTLEQRDYHIEILKRKL